MVMADIQGHCIHCGHLLLGSARTGQNVGAVAVKTRPKPRDLTSKAQLGYSEPFSPTCLRF